MKICPKIAHTVKGRERALNYAKSISKLESNNEYIYKLYHQYDSKPQDVYVKTTIQPSIFELLLAYIQFDGSEVNMSYGLGQEEIAEPILSDLYGVEVLDSQCSFDEEFDLYYIWEKWCGVADEVMDLKIFEKDGLHERLLKIIPEDN